MLTMLRPKRTSSNTHSRRIFTTAGLLLALAAASVEAQSALSFTLPFGPHAVGFRDVELFDYSRSVLASDSTGEQGVLTPRPIQVSVWYPARHTAGAKTMRYRDYVRLYAPPLRFAQRSQQGHAEAEQAMLRHPYLGLRSPDVSWNERQTALREAAAREFDTPTHAIRGAPDASGPFPIVVYHAGGDGPSFENDVLMEFLASHGYLVVAVPSWGGAGGSSIDIAGLETEVRDMEFALGYARSLPGQGGMPTALMGFSWGGMTSVLAASRLRPVSAVVGLDATVRYMPNVYRDACHERCGLYSVPTLFLNQGAASKRFLQSIGADTGFVFFDQLRYAPAYVVNVNTIKHQNFASWYNRLAGPQAEGFVADRAVASRGYERISQYVLTFLDAFLKSDSRARALLDQEPNAVGASASELTVQRKVAHRPLPTIASFAAAVRPLGLARAPETLRQVLGRDSAYTLPEAELTKWGWSLSGEEAIGVFTVRAMLYPISPAAHSDLGDAYLAQADSVNAVRSFERAFQLDSTATYSREMLTKLQPSKQSGR